jgi:hypothetical protein
MNLKTVFTLNAILVGIFGLGFLVAPAFLLSSFGAQSNPVAAMMAGGYGSAHIAGAIVSWLVRNNPPSRTRRVIAFAFAVEHALIALVILFHVLSGTINAMGWPTFLIDVLLTAGFIVFGKNEPAFAD